MVWIRSRDTPQISRSSVETPSDTPTVASAYGYDMRARRILRLDRKTFSARATTRVRVRAKHTANAAAATAGDIMASTASGASRSRYPAIATAQRGRLVLVSRLN